MSKELLEQLAPVFSETDKRYLPALKSAEEKADHALREIADLKAAPAFVSQDTRERGNTRPELSLSRLTNTYIRRKLDGDYSLEKRNEKEVEYLRKAFASGTTTAGGFLIPEDWNDQFIKELGAKAVVLQA